MSNYGRMSDRDQLHEQIDEIKAAHRRLVDAIAVILRGFEQNVFVRNTANDGSPDWALNVLPYVRALAVAQAYVDDLE